MKHTKLLDAAIVSALLLAYVPGLQDMELPETSPIALIAAAPDPAGHTQENPAERL